MKLSSSYSSARAIGIAVQRLWLRRPAIDDHVLHRNAFAKRCDCSSEVLAIVEAWDCEGDLVDVPVTNASLRHTLRGFVYLCHESTT